MVERGSKREIFHTIPHNFSSFSFIKTTNGRKSKSRFRPLFMRLECCFYETARRLLTGFESYPFRHISVTSARFSPDGQRVNPKCVTKPSVATDDFMRDRRTKGETPLHRAAAFGTEATIQMLLDAGVRVDAKDMNEDSALTWASWYLRPRPILRKLCYGEFHA
jgi:hypothetical protein